MAFKSCHHRELQKIPSKQGVRVRNYYKQWCWPDGKSWMEQEVLVSDMFVIMREESERALNRG